MRVIMEIIDGPNAGTAFTFDKHAVVLVGRSDRCRPFSVGDDPKCSRVHLIMEANPPISRIRDLGSTNHTYVNGQKVIQASLSDGDTMLIGSTTFKVRIEETEMDQVCENEDVFLTTEDSSEAGMTEGLTVRCARCGNESELTKSPPDPSGEHLFVCTGCREEMKLDGEQIPGYRYLSQLSKGGMGILWLAEETKTGRQVVVKTMIPDIASSWRMVQMFLRESRISLGLSHPNIVEFITAGQFDDQLFVVLEFVDGLDAEALRQQHGGHLPAASVVQIGVQVLDALEYAHSRDIVHRDLKPANIMVTGSEGIYKVKVTDFGLARNYRAAGMSDITQQGEIRGSIPYMSPEQVLDPSKSDPRTDVFGLGATIYHLLTGEFCYKFRKKEDPLVTIMETDTVPVETRGIPVSDSLASVINRALAKDPDQRFQSAAEMRAALSASVV